MFWKSSRRLFAAACIAGLAIGLAGCGGGSSSGGSSGNTGTLAVSMADAPDPTVTAVNVSIDRIEANVNGTWTKITSEPQTVNLLDLAKEDKVLGTALIAAGHYTQVRLFVSNASVVDANGPHDVTIPSATQTGIKINVDYDINPDQVTTILLDFNVHKSFVHQASGKYMMQPVIPAVVKVLSGTISGSVNDGTNPVAGATVTATPVPDATGTSTLPTRETQTLAGGTFKLWGVMPGSYTVTVTDSAGDTATYSGNVSVTAAKDTAIGPITLTAPAAAAVDTPPAAP